MVLRQELGRLQSHVDGDLHLEEERKSSCALDESAYQDACRIKGAAERDTSELEQQCRRAEEKLEVQEQGQRAVLQTWEDELVAWRALCDDAQREVSTACRRAADFRAARSEAEGTRGTMHAGLEAAFAELRHVHSVQSTLEAQRLHDARDESMEAQRLQKQCDAIEKQIAVLRDTHATLTEDLQSKNNEIMEVERLNNEARELQARLENEVAETHAKMLALRVECDDQRHACNHLVRLLSAAEQGQQQQSIRARSIGKPLRKGQPRGQTRTRSSSAVGRRPR